MLFLKSVNRFVLSISLWIVLTRWIQAQRGTARYSLLSNEDHTSKSMKTCCEGFPSRACTTLFRTL